MNGVGARWQPRGRLPVASATGEAGTWRGWTREEKGWLEGKGPGGAGRRPRGPRVCPRSLPQRWDFALSL